MSGGAPRNPRPTRPSAIESRRAREARQQAVARTRNRLILAAGVVMLVVAALIVIRALTGGGTASPGTGQAVAGRPIDGVQCGTTEGQIQHIHQHLEVIVDGKRFLPPAYVGIIAPKNCLYWIHIHDNSGVIHVESPVNDAVNFGQFLDIWSVTPDTMTVSGSPTITVDKNLLHTILTRKPSVVVVDGHPYSGDIRTIPLKAHTLITLGYGVKSVTQTPYNFSSVDGTSMPSH